MKIFALNAGSSSLKFALFHSDADGETEILRGAEKSEAVALQVLENLRDGKLADAPMTPDAIVCRVVHGGRKFTAATRVTPDVLQAIRELAPLAPLHNPAEADLLETAQSVFPAASAVAVFDTAFHHTLPPIAQTYALPEDLTEKYHLRRYGFHGVSHRYVSGELLRSLHREPDGSAVITCHLGNGSSLCAVQNGVSVDTSMGLTPLEGLVMGTRSGDVDAGLLLYLQREAKITAERLDQILNHESGLRGVSGSSADVRNLEKAAAGDPKAELALELFAYRARKYLGSYIAALGGCDGIAFTGGIGEHSAPTRDRICRNLGFFGITLDADANKNANGAAAQQISAADSRVPVWVIPTDEERQMARETAALLRASNNSQPLLRNERAGVRFC